MTDDWPSAVPQLRRALGATLRGEDWTWPTGLSDDAFLQAVRRHRVAETLADSSLALPDAVRRELVAARDRSRFRALTQARELHRVLTLLEDVGVRVLVVKGLALAAQTTGDFTARGVGDLDLFVDPADVARAHGALTDAGWAAERGFPVPGPSWAWRHLLATYCELPLSGERSAVDLHWHLAPTRGVLPEFEAACSRHEQVDVGGRPVPTLGRDHAWLHSCEHAMKDNWRWLRSLVDVERLSDPGARHRTVGVVRTLLLDQAPGSARDLRTARRAQTGPPPSEDGGGFPGLGVPLAIAKSVRGNARPREVARVTYRFLVVPTADVRQRSVWLAIPATLLWRARAYVRHLATWRRGRRTEVTT